MIQSIHIVGITEDLMGYGFVDGKKFKFPYVKQGDLVQFQTLGRGKRKFHRNLSPQEYGTSLTGCRYFSACGGCRARHLPYQEQFFHKTTPILSKFKESLGIELELVLPNKTESYRNRMDFAVFPGLVGLRQEGNFRKIVDIESCSLQSSKANLELDRLRDALVPFAYDRKSEQGFLKYITLRSGMDGELMTILTFIKEFKASREVQEVRELVSKISIAENIIFCYNRTRAEVSAMGEFEVIRGEDFLMQRVGGKILRIPFDSFFQPNPEGFSPILEFISKELEYYESEKMVDLFCGTGFFSLLFGDRFREILGVDILESSILHAKKNAELLYPEKRIEFKVLDLFSQKGNGLADSGLDGDSVAFIDPPRNGLGARVISFLLERNFEKIFYISCNPQSQLSDLQSLHEKYKISRGLLTDPYPHTPHMESVVLLERRHESNFTN